MKNNKQKNNFNMKNILKASVISLCVFAGAKALEETTILLGSPKDIYENQELKLSIVEEETGISTENNPNMIVMYYATQNDNLTPKQKSLVYQLSDLIKENPYINIPLSSKAILNLKIVFKEKPEGYKESTVGLFSSMNNEITIFVPEEELPNELLFHELVHCLFNNIRTFRLPDYFAEGTTELLTNEYYSESPFIEETTYPFEVTMIKMLCEMGGSDNVIKAYSEGDMTDLILEISNTIGEGNTLRLLKNAKQVFDRFESNHTVPEESLDEMFMIMDYFFTEKLKENGREDEMEHYAYYKDILMCMKEENPYESYIEYTNKKGILVQPYFSKQLKHNYPKAMRISKKGIRSTALSYQYVYHK